AAIAGNIEVARALLERGADTAAVDEEGLRAVDHAAQARRWPLVALLDPSYPLPVAGATDALDGEAGAGQDGAAQEEAGADEPDPREALREALRAGRCEHGNAVLARLLSPAELGELLLDEDAHPSVERIRWLLDRGADPEARVHGGHNAMTALLERGADAAPAIRLLLARAVPPSGPGGLARFMDACLRGPWRPRQPRHDRAAPGGRARARARGAPAGAARRLAGSARSRWPDAARRGPVQRPPRHRRVAGMARLAPARAPAAGDRPAGGGDRRRRGGGAQAGGFRLRRGYPRCPRLHRVAARRRRRPPRGGRTAARAQGRSATRRAHRRHPVVGSG